DGLTFGEDHPLTLTLTAGEISVGEAPSTVSVAKDASRQLVLELATLEPRTMHVRIAGHAHDVMLSAGLSRYSIESTTVPATVVVTTEGSSPVFVRTLSLRDASNALSALIEKRDVLVVTPTIDVEGTQVKIRLPYAGAEQWTENMAVGLNVGGNAI